MKQVFRGWILMAAMVSSAGDASAQEYFGEFLDQLKGAFDIEAKPRPRLKIDTDFRFKDPNGLLWSAPAGTSVDGASIPQAFWSIIGGPFEGSYINASVIHDYYCTTKERTAHDTHRNFYYGMRAAKVPEWKATLMHWAVSTFGPSWTLERRIVMEQSCTPAVAGAAPTCRSVPKSVVQLTVAPPVDLSDPEVLAAAVSKTNAVARTLLTTDGKVLDVTSKGSVPATVDGIEVSAQTYRKVFLAKDFASSPERLGLLSQTSGVSLADIKPWSNNRVPKLTEAVVLTNESLPQIARDAPFKLDPRSRLLIQDRLDLKKLQSVTPMRQ